MTTLTIPGGGVINLQSRHVGRVRPQLLGLVVAQVNAHNLGGAGVVGVLVVDGDGVGVADVGAREGGGLAVGGARDVAVVDLGVLLRAAHPVQLLHLVIQSQACTGANMCC